MLPTPNKNADRLYAERPLTRTWHRIRQSIRAHELGKCRWDSDVPCSGSWQGTRTERLAGVAGVPAVVTAVMVVAAVPAVVAVMAAVTVVAATVKSAPTR